ncbi:MAG: excinuclease ABC subunit UvrA [Candidatus Bathyarchaeota archaeon]|nr:excinuclease ABC subunit UvrA [Candidatus Bathyarchaeota archaeon]MCZ2845556.1 excinuclease ABC subunit UvrA [Candidatus Bathyarchaeota archaeon]
MEDKLIIKGAREHNLKNITVEIPKYKLVVITGLSGSGKSSLAFDTIYAEGQRRYIESLSAYARQFLGQLDKPDVDYIEGLSPAIAIEQRSASANPRSTVATTTEIHDYLRLLFSRIGKPYCHLCGRKIEKQTVEQIVDKIFDREMGNEIKILAPVIRSKKGEYRKYLLDFYKMGFIYARVDGRTIQTNEELSLERYKKHDIEIIVDELQVTVEEKDRIAESIQTTLNLTQSIVLIESKKDKQLFSEKLACPNCGTSIGELEPRMFSFNSPYGACIECTGLGVKIRMDLDLVIPDKNKTIREGAIEPFFGPVDRWMLSRFRPIALNYGFDFDTPIKNLSKEQLNILLYGTQGAYEYSKWEGILNLLERRYRQTNSESMKEWYEKFMSEIPCPSCRGDRLRKESLAVKINGINIADISKMPIIDALNFFKKLILSKRDQKIASQLLKEINERLGFLQNVGLGYITLERRTNTLSGGEAQRTQLATQIGSKLTGVLYVLDEPSIGLHPKDNKRLLDILKRLRDLGNTILVVEHDEDTIKESDFVIDLGPGAGLDGGKIVATGIPEAIIRNKDSITGKYLSHQLFIPIPVKRRRGNGKLIKIIEAEENNLKNVDVEIPLGVFTCITGVSGSGKSTLLNDILYRALAQIFHKSKNKPGRFKKLIGVENIDKVVIIDQSPIGRTPRSNPATYIGAFTPIRELFAKLPESKVRGYKPGRFSFNVKGGRCEACRGAGTIKMEMHFLPDVYIPCDVCKGKRYGRETLEILYKGKSITDVLSMTVDEALNFFKNIPQIQRKLQTIADVGLGYIKLGQSATTLSGGEAQRVKLSEELSKISTGRTMYILDEPTTGLHYADVQKLLNVIHRLVDLGNTILVIEHNLEVIKTADHIIDLGPEGGDNGGYIVATGTPEDIAMTDNSYTGQYLKKIFQQFLIEDGKWSEAIHLSKGK